MKNIAEPVPAYRVLSRPGTAAHRVAQAKRAARGPRLYAALALGAAALAIVASLAAWQFVAPFSEPEETAALKESGKPSIAVLPIANPSGEKEQEYFSDGITEDIITDLSKISGLLVISPNSTFRYKGQAVDVQRVGKELGVKFVLEGSVRKSGRRIRLSAQLIEAATGTHRWAERYDRELQEMFTLQDEITRRIVEALKIQLTMEETERIRRESTDNIEAWEQYAQGIALYQQPVFKPHFLARGYFEQALKFDPEFDAALLGLAWTHYDEERDPYQWSGPAPLKQAEGLARRVLAKVPGGAEAYALLGQIRLAKREHGKALEFSQRAVALKSQQRAMARQPGPHAALLQQGR